MRKSFIFFYILIYFLLIFSNTNIFAKEIFFQEEKKLIKIYIPVPLKYKVQFYNYGATITVFNYSYKKFSIFKGKDGEVIKIIPYANNKIFIKINSKLKDLKKHILINNNKIFEIKLFKKSINTANKINLINQKKKKNQNKLISSKSIIDEASENKLLPTAPLLTKNKIKIEEKLSNKHKVFSEKVLKNEETEKKQEKDFNIIGFNLTNKPEEKYNFSKNMIKTYSALFAICISLLLIAFFFKKFRNKINTFFPHKNQSLIKILFKEEIAPKKYIYVIRIFDDYFILGVTDYSINIIEKVSQDNTIEELSVIEGEREKTKFISYLKNDIKKENNKQENDKEKLIKLIQGKIRNYKNS